QATRPERAEVSDVQDGRRSHGLGVVRGSSVRSALVLAALVACKGREPEPSGVGQWSFTRSTLSDVKHGDCQPTKLFDGRQAVWCFGLTPYKIGKRVAEVDLYFLGTQPDARLIEIQLKVRGCLEDELDQFMRS